MIVVIAVLSWAQERPGEVVVVVVVAVVVVVVE